MNLHREFWEPASPQTGETVTSRTEKKYFGKISVTISEIDGKFLCFTDDIKESLFGNVSLQERLIRELSAQLRFYFDKYKIKNSSLILVAGIGNEGITADSLGCKVCDGLCVTSHYYSSALSDENLGNLSCVKCGVSGVTGVESYTHLSALSEKIKPNIILLVDTLAANTVARLSSSIQISDRGLEPGKGVGNAKKELNSLSLSVPVIAIGVPLVIYAQKIITDYCGALKTTLPSKSLNYLSDLVVTAKDIDFLIKDFAKIISKSINRAVHSYE